MPLVLSTKILNSAQKRHLFSAGIGLVEYDAVKIKALDINLPSLYFKNAIFTSQNAVRLAFEKNLDFENVFCVGEKTATLLSSHNLKPNVIADNAKSLAHEIVKNHSEKSFDFFCSAQRRDELPELINKHQIELREHHLYQSVSNQRQFKNGFDAVLCFSPLGVRSYFEIHEQKPMAICIGKTTAKEAKSYTSKVYQASKTSVESVVIKTIKTFASL